MRPGFRPRLLRSKLHRLPSAAELPAHLLPALWVCYPARSYPGPLAAPAPRAVGYNEKEYQRKYHVNISEQAQELLEQYWIIEEEHDTSNTTLEDEAASRLELVRLGLLAEKDGGLQLTPNGKVEACNAIRRHRLAERLMVDVLVTEEALVEQRACSLEHVLVNGIEESICTLLGHPRFCPHGKAIPLGRCCRQQRHSVGSLITPLNELEAGQAGHIAYVHLHNPQHLQKLMAMGVLPGAPVRLKAVYPSIVFEAGYSQFAVDDEIAREIFIRVENGLE
jgi:DtxR family transcriptional regulator, Mn-dependent transcriptional regulator